MKKRILFAPVSAVCLLVSMLPAAAQTGASKETNWPSFRGKDANGVAEGFSGPTTWDVEKSTNVRWKTPIPGLGHSSPIVWGNRVFVTSAISGKTKDDLKVGLYGDIESVNDDTVHQWNIYCLDKTTGKILWERTARKGVPQVKRHTKSDH